MGLGRFELPTPRLSSVCSNQLSYRPNGPRRHDIAGHAGTFKTRQDDSHKRGIGPNAPTTAASGLCTPARPRIRLI